jgi:hypothetical protein
VVVQTQGCSGHQKEVAPTDEMKLLTNEWYNTETLFDI